MVDRLIIETTFLIDLEREFLRGISGPAQALLQREARARLYITFTVAGELAAGPFIEDRPRWEEFVRPFELLPCTPDVCWEFGRAYRYLKQNGLLIGSNDLWIAATARANSMPVVTRNADHFRRVPDLQVVGYASGAPGL